jgi:hypothetical protein
MYICPCMSARNPTNVTTRLTEFIQPVRDITPGDIAGVKFVTITRMEYSLVKLED